MSSTDKMRWVVEIVDELYGPFYSLASASEFCDRFQARGSLKIRTLYDVPMHVPSGPAESPGTILLRGMGFKFIGDEETP